MLFTYLYVNIFIKLGFHLDFVYGICIYEVLDLKETNNIELTRTNEKKSSMKAKDVGYALGIIKLIWLIKL